MVGISEEIAFSLFGLSVVARGWVAFGIMFGVALILIAIAWRIAVGARPKKSLPRP